MSASAGPETAKGDELAPTSVRVSRADLVRYAGASGDFNPIHWSDRVAGEVGLPGVIAHGMLTMALAGRFVSAWAGGPAAVRGLGVRFTRPVVVPDDGTGATIELSGTVSGVDESDAGRVATVAVTAKFDGRTVLGRATAEVLLPS
ncbi:MaoC/PaaZ C-terminal domain-containing protein [Pseudonocardia humida]|uniref:MaoC family dehydratase N-terminal domain-containing protein n=1 Tax=Pseudonocardia humida TaxID=2800819 RepID=A0ABT0ZW91_9PSEU|nr:MaoC/PaaZ C-terminal domain-containing protein [Pseudonocardia humida]MCO1655005.1 MaoC family dehydratase N-terminal domain-containing protein [Pseudonocardia humida]